MYGTAYTTAAVYTTAATAHTDSTAATCASVVTEEEAMRGKLLDVHLRQPWHITWGQTPPS